MATTHLTTLMYKLKMSNKRVITKHLSWVFSEMCFQGNQLISVTEEKLLLLEECQQVKVDEIARIRKHLLQLLNEIKYMIQVWIINGSLNLLTEKDEYRSGYAWYQCISPRSSCLSQVCNINCNGGIRYSSLPEDQS